MALLLIAPVSAQQNPSPMVEHTRPHPRLQQSAPDGRRERLALGTLFIPAKLAKRTTIPLIVHFHGGTWLPEMAVSTDGHFAVIAVQAGSG